MLVDTGSLFETAEVFEEIGIFEGLLEELGLHVFGHEVDPLWPALGCVQLLLASQYEVCEIEGFGLCHDSLLDQFILFD